MKKIKLLFLGLFAGLLFNQCFGLDIELVPINDLSQYLVSSQNAGSCDSMCWDTKWYFYYSISYNYGLQNFYSTPLMNTLNCGCYTQNQCNTFTFGNSVFSQELYNSSSWGQSSCTYKPTNTNQVPTEYARDFDSPEVLLGTNYNLGQAFLCVDCLNAGSFTTNPKFGFGDSYILGDSYEIVKNSTSDYFRFLYEGFTGFDINSLDLVNLSGNHSISGWEYFTKFGVYTNFGRISDFVYTYKRFGLYGYGYSLVGRASYTPLTSFDKISRNDLRFLTMSDTVEVPLKLMASNNQYILGLSDLTGFFYNGILLLPSTSYHSGSNSSQYLIAKDRTNPSRVVYEKYDCQFSDIGPIFSGTTNCHLIDAGYLTYNNSTSVLPFTDYTTETGLSNNDYPLLGDLTIGSRGSTTTDSNGFKIGNHYYGFFTNPSVSIKSMYLDGNINQSQSDVINSEIFNKCLNPDFYQYNSFICQSIFGSDVFNNAYAFGSGYYYYNTFDENGNPIIEIIDQAGLFSGTYQGTGVVWIQDSNGNRYTNCYGGWCNPNPYNTSGSVFLTGDGTNGYYLDTGYYDFGSNGTGIFFKCPWPVDKYLKDGGFNLDIGDFNFLLLPINCSISAFQYGKSFDFLDNVGLFNFGPLINGNTQQHRILFRFFDFLLLLGLFFFTKALSKFK